MLTSEQKDRLQWLRGTIITMDIRIAIHKAEARGLLVALRDMEQEVAHIESLDDALAKVSE